MLMSGGGINNNGSSVSSGLS
jgi:tetratricopeptide (TPR) repeat protein